MVQPNAWDAIVEVFGKKNASLHAFARKLGNKYGWDKDFTYEVIEEYKRFVYIAMISDFVVSPSEIIDKIWHQHILFSRGYRKFCDEVIGKFFDHTPELVPSNIQTAIFNAQYRDTIELYKKEFDADPPAHIWDLTKFDSKTAIESGHTSKKKKKDDTMCDVSADNDDNVPLFMLFDTNNTYHPQNSVDFLGDGGTFGGGGSSGSWGATTSGEGSSGGGDGGGGGNCSGGGGGCGGGGD